MTESSSDKSVTREDLVEDLESTDEEAEEVKGGARSPYTTTHFII